MKNKILAESIRFSITSILGPVLVLGGIGYALGSYFGKEKVFLLSAIAVSFIVTQILAFRKVSKGYSKIASFDVKKDDAGKEDEALVKEK